MAERQTGRIAYLLGKPIPLTRAAELTRHERPRVEFDVLLEQHPELVALPTGEDPPHGRADRLKERILHHLALADGALTTRPRYRAFLCASEETGIPLALAARARFDRRPIVIITHGSFFASPKFALVMRVLRRMENVSFLALSSSLTRSLQDDFGVPEHRAVAAGYATDTDFFHPAEAPEDPQLVVGVGMANRDYQVLVDSALPLGANLEIAADSAWYRSAVRVEVEHSATERVKLGSYAYPELRSLYARARVVAITMKAGKHACGYSAIAEAMAMGKPVIATRTESPCDFIVDGETGFYVEPGDRDALANRIQQLLVDDGLARRMGESGRRRMQEFGVEQYAGRIAAGLPLNSWSEPALSGIAPKT